MRLLHGECRQVMVTLEADSFDAIVTDPPYHLTNQGGGPGRNTNNAYTRARAGAANTGFMGKHWDGGDVAFQPDTWAAALRVAKPGAYLAAFGGTRTFHRLACAIEDAGWELRDTLMWLYGSGFPKSHNGVWGGTALKPAWEPIILARKPPIGTIAANFAVHGTGGLNIEACRVEGEVPDTGGHRGGIPCRHDETTPRPARNRDGEASAQRRYADKGGTNFAATPGVRGGDPAGRWPANVVHDGSEQVVACFPAVAGAKAPVRGTEPTANGFSGSVAYSGMLARSAGAFHGDTGSAARFFYCAKTADADRNDGCGLPGTPPRNVHPTVKPTELMRWLCRLLTPKGGHILDPFCGSGSTGRGALAEGFEFTGIDLEAEHLEISRARIVAMPAGLALEGIE